MSKRVWYRLRATAFAIALAGVSAWPTSGSAQTVTGQARAVQVNGTTVLTDTGTLGGTSDSRDATLDVGVVPSVLSGEILRAVTIGWPDQVASETSLANLTMTIGGTGISAGFVMARALAVLGQASTADSMINNLSVNETGIVSPNVLQVTSRTRTFWALQQAFLHAPSASQPQRATP